MTLPALCFYVAQHRQAVDLLQLMLHAIEFIQRPIWKDHMKSPRLFALLSLHVLVSLRDIFDVLVVKVHVQRSFTISNVLAQQDTKTTKYRIYNKDA
jgi:hypothetical protein